MKAEFLFLGTGGSSGIPMIGCTCRVCTSSDPHNKRLRPAGLITCNKKRLLIDCGPDFRQQALCYHIDHLDGVVLTHSHFDHVAGLDELRVYYLLHRIPPLPVLVSEPTLRELKGRSDYLFREKSTTGSLTAQLDFQVITEERGTAHFLGFEVKHIRFDQAGMPVTGYRFGSLAYISDIRTFPETIYADLAEIKILVLSALRYESSRLHFNLNEAIAFAQKVGAEETYFTHMAHELDHAQTNARLPKGVQLAYDGLKLTFTI
jgi:phosphoribosyl 1,2-cyclic phosphate phosphodiesterase